VAARLHGLLLVGLVASCAAPAAEPPPVVAASLAPAARSDGPAQRAELRRVEGQVLETLGASDPRFAKRVGGVSEDRRHAAVVKALAEGDADTAVVEGALDSFSFTARRRAIDEAARALDAAPGAGSAEKGERELLQRLVDEERLRLEEERPQPRGASALLRGVVDTWTPPGSPEAAASRDAWLARRLGEVRTAVGGTRLSRAAALDLDDALDPLERLASPADLPSSAKAIAELRIALGVPFGTEAIDDARRARVEAGIRGHLGVSLATEPVRARLESAERATRALAKEGVAQADERAVAKRAEGLTFAEGSCGGDPAESRVRALAPPPERAPICGALRALAGEKDAASRAAAWVALHDEVVVALWAFAVHEEGRTLAQARGEAHPYFGVEPEREGRLVRFAEVRPVAAIGAGLAAEIVVRTQAAERWLAFGDAPLDVVERELAVSRASPPPPASPRP
jgi:hypothetical protein